MYHELDPNWYPFLVLNKNETILFKKNSPSYQCNAVKHKNRMYLNDTQDFMFKSKTAFHTRIDIWF